MNLIIYIYNHNHIYISHAKRKKNPNLILKTVIKSQENKRRTRTRKTYKTKNTMAIRTCILIITLNLTGLNALIKDNEWLKKKAAYKRCTSDLKIHTD